MKTMILAALAALSLGISVANADPRSHMMPQQNQNQNDWTIGGAGWG